MDVNVQPISVKKTDMHLKEDALSELKRGPKVNPTSIDVQVRDDVVTLSGYVDSLTKK